MEQTAGEYADSRHYKFATSVILELIEVNFKNSAAFVDPYCIQLPKISAKSDNRRPSY